MRGAETVTFGPSALDRAAHLRKTAADIWSQEAARAIVLWRGKPLLDRDGGVLVRLAAGHPILQIAQRAPAFLGLLDAAPVFAVDISPWEPADIDAEEMKKFFDASENHHPDLPAHQVFVELRGLMAILSPDEANLAAIARALFSWHDSHEFCARCGARSEIVEAGWQRSCTACPGQHFPRTDPVVIVLATHGNRVLLGRSPFWPEGMYSLLAGFVEPGESIEAASRREVFEESGIRLGDVTYLSSQPWPFPTSLMFGTASEALTTDITLDPDELEDAQWVSKEALLDAFAGNNPALKPARRGSIARFLLDRWIRDDLM